MNRATLRQTAARSGCVANLCLSILAAAALRGEERGEAEDSEDERADRHCSGEVQFGTGALRLRICISLSAKKTFCSRESGRQYNRDWAAQSLACLPADTGSNEQLRFSATRPFLCVWHRGIHVFSKLLPRSTELNIEILSAVGFVNHC